MTEQQMCDYMVKYQQQAWTVKGTCYASDSMNNKCCLQGRYSKVEGLKDIFSHTLIQKSPIYDSNNQNICVKDLKIFKLFYIYIYFL